MLGTLCTLITVLSFPSYCTQTELRFLYGGVHHLYHCGIRPRNEADCHCEELKTDKATLVCLAQMPVWFADVSWTSNGSPVTGGVFTSAAEQKPDKTFGLSSFLTIKSSEWISDRVFNCKVSVGSKKSEKSLKKSDCSLAHSAASSTSKKGLSPHDAGVSRSTIVMSPTPSAVGNKGSA
ncbi:hypothetical protein SKAU_G00301620 [Synaphobranchus kaupii]|uniref:Ig-like domain-containing protein n=1 Tax=Synaphobranchus kaupii TaxID=118154 RepID=A0A9Q1EVS5_SYNKA|nr:hypothetical protein SKAU_G00301620 [Synaphobranchus kaupii]